MKRSFAALTFSIILSFADMTANAQSGDMLGVPPYGPTHVGTVDIHDSHSRSPVIPREPKVIKRGQLAPAEADRLSFATLLKEENSGLIRLLPFEAFERDKNQRRLFIREGGPFFSFASRTHSLGLGSDIAFNHDKISAGFGGVNYGMLTSLGDIPLEAITLSDARLKSVAAFLPSKTQAVAQEMYTRLTSSAGMTFDGRVYRNELPAQSNSTYLVRSIVDRQSDVLVAFRLVRKDHDGSVIIAWKLLKQYPTPKLKRTTPRFR